MSARVIIAFLLAWPGLTGPSAAEGWVTSKASSAPAQVRCSAAGAKLFAPAMTAAAICARFAAGLRGATAAGEALTVDLSFHANGVATAIVTVSRGGTIRRSRDYNLAVSDRRFGAADIDRLAASVVAGLRLDR